MNSNKSPRISVVMTAYNDAEYIAEAIESVLAQDVGGCEVVFVDDGSTEDVHSVVAPYADRVRYIRQDNGGIGVARNAGIRAARGEYVAICDSDDIQLPYRMSAHAALLDQAPAAGQVFSDLSLYEDGVVTSETTLRGRDMGPAEMEFDDLLAHCFPPARTARERGLSLPDALMERKVYQGRVPDLIAASHVAWSGASMYRRAAVIAMGLHDESLRRWAGWQLSSLISKNYEMIYLDVPVLLYRQHADQLTKQPAIGAKAYRDIVYSVWKNDPVFAARQPALLTRLVKRAAMRHAYFSMQAGDYTVAREHLLDYIKAAPLDRRGYTALARNLVMDKLVRRLRR